MNLGLIPVRYAAALFDFAETSNAQEIVYRNAMQLAESLAHSKELHNALENPVLSKENKRKVILTASGINTSPVFQSFIDLVLRNNRESLLHSTVLKYEELYRKKNNILHGKLTTAVAVDKTTEEKLIKLVEKQITGTLELEKVVDPSILGGFLMEIDSVRWDASIKNQLNRIKSEYIERNRRIV